MTSNKYKDSKPADVTTRILAIAMKYGVRGALLILSIQILALAWWLGRHVELTGKMTDNMRAIVVSQNTADAGLVALDERFLSILESVVTRLDEHDKLLIAIQGGDKDAKKLAELINAIEESQRDMGQQFDSLRTDTDTLVKQRVEALSDARKQLEDRVLGRLDVESNRVLAWSQIATGFVLASNLVLAILLAAAWRKPPKSEPGE